MSKKASMDKTVVGLESILEITCGLITLFPMWVTCPSLHSWKVAEMWLKGKKSDFSTYPNHRRLLGSAQDGPANQTHPRQGLQFLPHRLFTFYSPAGLHPEI